VDTSIPDGFGETQKDAGTFMKATFKNKKRKLEDIIQTNGKTEENQIDPNSKRS
jgi:hypothetical protein